MKAYLIFNLHILVVATLLYYGRMTGGSLSALFHFMTGVSIAFLAAGLFNPTKDL